MNFEHIISANKSRNYFSAFNENPKSYDEILLKQGLQAFQTKLNTNYLLPGNKNREINFYGEEVSPYLLTGLGIHYSKSKVSELISNAVTVSNEWSILDYSKRLEILLSSLEKVKTRFFELAFATMHTTGQSFLMSFQASGPHACDRALEVLATASEQLGYYPKEVNWIKNMGKFDLVLKKNYKPIPKGIALVIGCSTFPTWNSIPGLYASLITGNPVILKPHPKAVYPIAIFIEELKNALIEANINPNVVQLAIDGTNDPITKELVEHESIQLIDYTGGNLFGDYIESVGKTCFTEKAGINSILIDSCNDFDKVAQNIAFSVSLYSGQMCTAPQNIYIPENGILTDSGILSYDDCFDKLKTAFKNLFDNPKAAAPTLGAIQNEQTKKRILDFRGKFSFTEFNSHVVNEEFPSARIMTPTLIEFNAKDSSEFLKEVFGPIAFIIKTTSFEESLSIIKTSAKTHGAITCSTYTLDQTKMSNIESEMNSVFTPVSFNFIGAAFVNQHAAFSDLHVSGGNPSGNASFTNAEFINKRYIWIGNRYM